MNQKSKKNYLLILLLLLLVIGSRIYSGNTGNDINPEVELSDALQNYEEGENSHNDLEQTLTPDSEPDILELTDEKVVVAYLKKYHRLPDYYITKREAQEEGWIASEGNLCEVLPGRAIGGDNFGNREKLLPAKQGRKYYEADINYNCGTRNADRIVFSNDQLIYVSKDHYKSFEKQ